MRATPEKGDSQRVAMTAHFQVRTLCRVILNRVEVFRGMAKYGEARQDGQAT